MNNFFIADFLSNSCSYDDVWHDVSMTTGPVTSFHTILNTVNGFGNSSLIEKKTVFSCQNFIKPLMFIVVHDQLGNTEYFEFICQKCQKGTKSAPAGSKVLPGSEC